MYTSNTAWKNRGWDINFTLLENRNDKQRDKQRHDKNQPLYTGSNFPSLFDTHKSKARQAPNKPNLIIDCPQDKQARKGAIRAGLLLCKMLFLFILYF